ncbi:MAG: ABC transporter permease subunit [Candidatus Thermoplasmatota archaeon]|nr:ABC transporter permease subunit [Candidatus Thermoplasmatota archaeon]
MRTATPGIERIFSWSSIDPKSRVVILVSLLLICTIPQSTGQETITGWGEVESWTDNDLNAAVIHGTNVWVFGDFGTVRYSEDNGATWHNHSALGNADLIAADSLDDSMAVLSADGIIHMMFGLDADWQKIDSGQSGINGIAVTGEQSVVIVGDKGAIWQYTDETWWNRTTTFNENLHDVAFNGDQDGLAVGDAGTILATNDGGATWDYRAAPDADSSIVSVSYFNPYRMFAVSDSGQILYSTSPGGFEWKLREIESMDYETTLATTLSSIEVVSSSRILFAGPDGYLGLSLDQGLNVERNILPAGVNTSFNDHAMFDYVVGIVVGDSGVILFTDRAGENEDIGFEIPDYNNFGEFVEYADDMLLAGFIATVKIVVFGILLGFTIGIILAMLKTAPTSFKNVLERYSTNQIRGLGAVCSVIGLWLLYTGVSRFPELQLEGLEYIFTPVGDPQGFAMFALGLAIVAISIQFILADKKLSGPLFKVRPLNSLATVYTDFFRNTPLIVQFMFIHFGLRLGMRIQQLMEGTFGDPGIDGIDYFFYGDRTFLSAIFTLGLNSGAYQCETIRGAISAIPSGQMEAGRSIGLTYLGTMRLVILPQAIRICIPPIGNEMVNLVLNSSLAMVIGYSELSRQGKLMIATTFQIFSAWGLVMISYFVVTWTLALILRRLEDTTRIPGLGISGGS